MPLMSYFGSVGSALLVLLFVANWLIPQPAEGPVQSGGVRPPIRISSVERLPERVVIDTNLPTIVPPQIPIEYFEQPPQARTIEITSDAPQAISSHGAAPKKQTLAKREAARKNVTPRIPQSQIAQSRSVQPAAPAVRMSLLDMFKQTLQHGPFNLN